MPQFIVRRTYVLQFDVVVSSEDNVVDKTRHEDTDGVLVVDDRLAEVRFFALAVTLGGCTRRGRGAGRLEIGRRRPVAAALRPHHVPI